MEKTTEKYGRWLKSDFLNWLQDILIIWQNEHVRNISPKSFDFPKYRIMIGNFFIPLRFGKVGRVWCGGARETHWATCCNEVTPSKTKEFLKSPCFFFILMVVRTFENNSNVILSFVNSDYCYLGFPSILKNSVTKILKD